MKRLLLAIGLLASLGAVGQTVNLLKDINAVTNAAGSSPSNFTNVGGVIFFTATDPERGTELWKTNGTGAGTVVVKDINPGSGNSIPSSPYLTAIGSTVYFSANDGVNGFELWKSDGTSAGTVMVKDINSTGNSSPSYIIAVGANLYFAADNGTNGREVWKSDGTSANTAMLTEIYSGTTGSNPAFLTNANGTIYFRATHPSYGTELWKTTGGAPSLVEDIYAGSSVSSNPSNLTALNAASSSVILFSANEATNGTELWVSSGTAATTNVVSIYQLLTGFGCGLAFCPIYDYSGSSSPDNFASTGTYVYFAATATGTGREVYRHDGTTLTLVEDEVASGDLSPQNLTNVNGTIYFSGSNGGDRELYKATTSAVTPIAINGSGSSNPSDFEPGSGSTVYFTATEGTFGSELYSSSGSTATRLTDINTGSLSSSPTNKAFLGGVIYLSATRSTDGTELWLYNGSASLLKDINGGSEDSYPSSILNTGTNLYFQATTSTLGAELWKSDGTSINTVNVADINTTPVTGGTDGSYAFPFGFTNSLVHLQAYTPAKGYEFYVSSGSGYTLREINNSDETGSSPASSGYVTLGNTVYFTAYHPSSGTELWKSTDGAAATLVGGGTGLYAGTGSSYPYELTVYGSFVYFSATDDADGNELYRTSGSSIQLVSQLNLGSGSSYPYGMCVSNGRLFWAADNGSDGYELFYTTSTGANMVKTGGINPGSGNANPSFMTDLNGTLFFRAIDGSTGSELWKADGTNLNTASGAVMVKDINTTPSTGSSPNNLTAVGTMLYFSANEPTYGTELYKSDGTTGGTVLVKDIFSGVSNSSPSVFKNINGTLYFRASNGAGLNLMKTNGTTAGTVVANSVSGTITYQDVSDIQYLNQNVYWVATTNTYGREILYVKAEPLNQPTLLVINGATQATLNLSWTAAGGSPAGYIVARHSAGIPTGLPVDGPAPGLNTPLVSGTGTVAYVGTSTSFTDTGLSPSTTYYYAVYSYNDGGLSTNIYKPHTPLTGSKFTIAANPTGQATGPFTSNVATTSITFNWSSGNGSERIVLAKQSASAISDVPIDGTAYTPNALYGTPGAALGSSFVVYRGTGTSVNVTGLTIGLQYQFIVFELNGTGTQTNYLTSIAGASASATTLSGLGDQPTNLNFSSIGTSTISLSWSDATAVTSDNGYVVTRKAGSDPTDVPQNGVDYSAGNTIGSSTVVYDTDIDANTSFTDPINPVTMSAGTVYFYRIYAKSAATTYVVSGPLTGAQTTLAAEPAAPGAISYTPGTTTMTGSFAAGAGATSYIVLQREAGVVFPDAPVDGVNYAVNDMRGSSKVVYVGASPGPFTSTGLTSSTLYYYAAFSAAGSGAAINYLTASPSASSRATLVDDPADQPTDLLLTSVTPTSLDVSFSEAAIIPTGYIVLRSAGAPVTFEPVDGVIYNVNDVSGGATVVAVGSSTSFSESSLTPGTTYYYAAMSYSGFSDSRNYLVTGAATGSVTTPAAEPTAQAGAINFTNRSTTSLTFNFSAAAGTPDGYLIIRSSGAAPTAVPTDGDTYTAGGLIGPDAVVQVGSSTSVVDDNFTDELVEDTHYYYAIFSYNGSGGTTNYLTTSPRQGNAFTWADEPTEHPTNMVFSLPTTTSMTVAFDEPAALPAGYLVVRKAGSAPTGIPTDGNAYALGNTVNGDGTVAYIGSAPTFPSTGLSASTVYHYAVYPFKGSGLSSNFLSAPTVLIGNRTSLQNEPTAQPTGLLISNVTTSSAQINFTTSGSATRYIIVRRDGVAPIETPDDGVVYPDDTPLGLSTVTHTANVLPFTDGTGSTSPMLPGLRYYYAIYGYNATSPSALNANYFLTVPLTGYVDILALAPTTQPTLLTFSAITSSTLNGSFTAATGSPDGYLVVRKQNSVPTGLPQQGVTYNDGDPLGDGEVVFAGTSTNFSDNGLSAEGTYHYKVFSYNDNGNAGSINYFTASPLTNNVTTLDSEPSQPTGFGAGRATTSIDLGFTPSDAQHYLILRKEGGAPTANPVDGIGYTAGTDLGDSKVVLAGSLPVIDNGLTPETVYHYAVFGFNGTGAATFNYNTVSPLRASFSTLANEPVASPTGLNFSGTTVSGTTVSFTAATGSPTGYIVLRKEGSAVTGTPTDGAVYSPGNMVGDGEIVRIGSAVSFGDAGLSAFTTYHYKVFSYNGSGSAVNFFTTSSLSGSFKTLATEPAQPTLFTSSNLTTTSFSISMTLSDAEHYLILRQAGAVPQEIPTDGTAYVTGQPFGSSLIVLADNITLPIAQTGLSPGTVYYYVIYGYNGAGAATYNYNTTSPLSDVVGTVAAEPSSQATALSFTAITNSSATVSFTEATSSPAGYLVLRRDGALPSTPPSDGTTYDIDETIFDGTVVYVGAALTFDESGLTTETIYHYQVFAYNGNGLTINYRIASPLTASFSTLSTEPTQPTSFVVSDVTANTIEFSYTLSTAAHYLILRNTVAPPEVPADGSAYVTGSILGGGSKVVRTGDAGSFPITDTGLTPGTTYHYAIYGFNGTATNAFNYNKNSPLTATPATLVSEPGSSPSGLTFSGITANTATISFTAAAGSPTGYIIIRRAGAQAANLLEDGVALSPGDPLGGGTVVSMGSSVSFDDAGLDPETIYHYSVYAYNGAGSSINYLTSSSLTNSFSTLAVEPQGATAFVGISGSMSTVSISFSLSPDADHYVIFRKANTAPAATPADGTTYTEGTTLSGADIFLAGNVGSFPLPDVDLDPATVYHYAIFAYNGNGPTVNYNTTSPLIGSVGTLDAEPAAQPVNMAFSAVTATGMTVSFTAAVGSPEGYMAVRRQDAVPTGSPVDGHVYNVNDPLGTGVVAYVGSAQTFSDTGLNPESTYHYNIYSFNGSGLTASFLKTSPLTNSRSTLAVEPEQPTGFLDSNIGATSLSFTFSESDADHYLILRRAVTAPTENPVDGTTYVTGGTLGNSTIVLAGDIVSLPINEPVLLPNTIYHYKIFGYNGAALTSNYNMTAPLLGTTGTLAGEPSSQPAPLVFSNITSNSADLSFAAPAGSPAGYLVIRKQDTAPSATPVDGDPYSDGDPLGTGTIVNVGPELSIAQPGLTPQKVYHYLVFAYNGSGSVINYLSTAPTAGSFTTLAIEPTSQPTALEFANIDTDGFTVSFVAATGTVSGYIALRKESTDPTAVPADGTTYSDGNVIGDSEVAFVGSAVTFDETIPPNDFHYAIFAFNGSGASINYRTVGPLIDVLPADETPPVITDKTDATLLYKNGKTFSFEITDADGEVKSASLVYRRLNATDVISVDLDSKPNDRYEVTLTANDIGEQGIVYHGLAVNEADLESTTAPVVLRSTFTTSQTLPPLNAGTDQKGYRIISVPLELTNKGGGSVFTALDGKTNGTDWRMFRWENNATREYTSLGDVQINPGEGYWLISKTTLNIAPGNGQALDITAPFDIPVTSGWNQIGNPYLFNVWWADVNSANGSTFTLRTFEGGTNFVNDDILTAFSGGFVFVGGSVNKISIPTKKNSLAGGRGSEKLPKTNPLDSEDWEVIINLRHGEVANPFGGVGMSRQASAEFDYYDDFNLPRFMDFVELNHPKKAFGASYTKDIIPLAENHVWEFSIEASNEGLTDMTWDNSYFGANDKELVLWDEEEQMAIDMRKERSYSIAHHAERRFKIFYGNHAFIEEQAAANSVLIHTIFPNPATAEVSVSFSIPGRDRSNVNVRVVNGMGQQIATVFDGELEAGFHTMQWSGNDYAGQRPATGVYLVEVINGENRTSKRLVMK